MAVNEDGLRTELRSGTQWHGRVHAKPASFVGGGRNHAAFISLTSDDNSLAFQRGIEEFFYGDEEGVHVDVEDGFGSSSHRCHSVVPSEEDRLPNDPNSREACFFL